MSRGREEYMFLWFIENYTYCWHKNGEELFSPCFTADELERTNWSILVYPRGWMEVDKGNISLFLHRSKTDKGPEIVPVNYELSVLDANGSCLGSRKKKYNFKKDDVSGFSNFVQRKDVPDGTLTVRCRIWRGEGEVRKVAPICARTRIAVESISFLHVVVNFSALEPNQKKKIDIRSHSKKEFGVSSSLYFDHDANCEGELILEITSLDSNHIICKQKVSLIHESGIITACGEKNYRSDAESEDNEKLILSLTRNFILSKKDEYLPDDTLLLLCKCVFSTGLEFEKIEGPHHETPMATVKQVSKAGTSQNEDHAVEEASAYPDIVEDLKALYVKQCFTDVEVKTKTKSFPAHKIMLCVRSSVFEAMLTNDMKEKETGCIQVDDLGDDIVQQMLLFLYSDRVENLQWGTAIQLYFAGDKYQIGKLKEVCSNFLVESLTATNAGQLLVLADTHNDTELKTSVEDFILEHEDQVFGSKEWETVIETNPALVLKTIHLKYKRRNELN